MPDFFKLIVAGVLLLFTAIGFLFWIATYPVSLFFCAALTAIIVWLLNRKLANPILPTKDMSEESTQQLSHLDEEGRIKMVDVGAKSTTARTAEASGFVQMSPETVAAIRERRTPKGDPLETARLAGIMAAKRTAELIPLCHSLALSHADVQIALTDKGAQLWATASTNAQTGVEMEALTAVSVAALTLYDMCKAIDKGMTIGEIQLERKTGGRSGEWQKACDE